MELTLTFWKDQPVLTTILQIVAAVLLLVAFVFCCATLGVFTKEFNDLKDIADGNDACFLYYDFPKPGANSYCEFIIAGQSIILIALVILMILLLVAVFIRFGFQIHLIIFLIVSIITFLLSFVATIVLSAGFAKTCTSLDDQAKCSDLFGRVYDTMQDSTALSWIETISVGALVAVASVYVVRRMRKSSSETV